MPQEAGVFWIVTISDIDYVDDSIADPNYYMSTPYDSPAVTLHEVFNNELYNNVLNDSGAAPSDAVDLRLVSDVRNGTGSFIDSQSQVGGWPVLSGPASPADGDNDGMPDSWETAHGLNLTVNDSADDRDGDGYTNIEEYINSL